MNQAQALSVHLKVLVAVHGRRRVQEALAHIDDIDAAQLERELKNADTKSRETADRSEDSARKPRRRKGVLEYIQESGVGPDISPLVKRIAYAYEGKTFLPELWMVRKFLESEGVDAANLRSRAAALPRVIEVLSRQPCRRLEELLAQSEHSRGDLAILTDQILGRPTNDISP